MKKVVVFLFLGIMFFGSCSNKQSIVGTWTDIEGITWVFNADGKLAYANSPGNKSSEYQYSITDDALIIFGFGIFGEDKQQYKISFTPDGKTLMLTGGRDMFGWRVAGPGWSDNRLTKNNGTANGINYNYSVVSVKLSRNGQQDTTLRFASLKFFLHKNPKNAKITQNNRDRH